jgi:competence protein ComEC
VRTASHDLLFDTGPQYSPEADAGERIVIPYLRAVGTSQLDAMIVSHDDKDHSGGAESLLREYPPRVWRSSLPAGHALLALPVVHQPCRQAQSWEWDGLRFEILHPTDDFAGSDNDMSCVLRVSGPHGSALLTGDISVKAESLLLASGQTLHADVLVAPHHGSRSSSQQAFIDAVGARQVIFTSGYRNRYHHPAPEVVARYAQSGATLYRSDAAGAVRFRLDASGISTWQARLTLRRYWHDQTY